MYFLSGHFTQVLPFFSNQYFSSYCLNYQSILFNTLPASMKILVAADDLPKQFGSDQARNSGSRFKLFDTMLSLKEYFGKNHVDKYQQTTKNMKNYPACKVKSLHARYFCMLFCRLLI